MSDAKHGSDPDLGPQPTRVGNWQTDDCDIYGGRSTTRDGHVKHLWNTEVGERGWLGNPFVTDEHAGQEHYDQPDVHVLDSREDAVAAYCQAFLTELENNPEYRRALYEDVRGRVLGGWCQSLEDDGPLCHLEVVAAVADRITKRGEMR